MQFIASTVTTVADDDGNDEEKTAGFDDLPVREDVYESTDSAEKERTTKIQIAIELTSR